MYLNQNETTETDYKKLFNIQKLENFVEIMSDQYKPTTRAKKLRQIKLAIKFVIRQNDDKEVYYRGTIDNTDEWCHGLGKKTAIQRQEYALVMRKTLPQIIDPNKFWNTTWYSELCRVI